MGEEAAFLAKYAPYYVPILSAIILILFTKNYLFRGMVSNELYKDQLEREKEIVKGAEQISHELQEIVAHLENLTKKVSEEIGSNTERLRSLEMAMSDYLDAFRELNYNFEKHRKGIPDTQEYKSKRP
jgi:hypothetical protein